MASQRQTWTTPASSVPQARQPEGALHFSDAGEHSSAPAGPTPRQRVDRIERLLRNLEPIVQHIPNAGDCGGLCLIEGYAYGARNKGHDLGELGGLLRCWVLDHWCGAVVECSPGQVKRFATGRGNASKVQVASALASRYGVEFATDNEADAFGILQLGRCVVGQLEPETKAQRAVVADLRVAYEAELDEVSA